MNNHSNLPTGNTLFQPAMKKTQKNINKDVDLQHQLKQPRRFSSNDNDDMKYNSLSDDHQGNQKLPAKRPTTGENDQTANTLISSPLQQDHKKQPHQQNQDNTEQDVYENDTDNTDDFIVKRTRPFPFVRSTLLPSPYPFSIKNNLAKSYIILRSNENGRYYRVKKSDLSGDKMAAHLSALNVHYNQNRFQHYNLLKLIHLKNVEFLKELQQTARTLRPVQIDKVESDCKYQLNKRFNNIYRTPETLMGLNRIEMHSLDYRNIKNNFQNVLSRRYNAVQHNLQQYRLITLMSIKNRNDTRTIEKDKNYGNLSLTSNQRSHLQQHREYLNHNPPIMSPFINPHYFHIRNTIASDINHITDRIQETRQYIQHISHPTSLVIKNIAMIIKQQSVITNRARYLVNILQDVLQRIEDEIIPTHHTSTMKENINQDNNHPNTNDNKTDHDNHCHDDVIIRHHQKYQETWRPQSYIQFLHHAVQHNLNPFHPCLTSPMNFRTLLCQNKTILTPSYVINDGLKLLIPSDEYNNSLQNKTHSLFKTTMLTHNVGDIRLNAYRNHYYCNDPIKHHSYHDTNNGISTHFASNIYDVLHHKDSINGLKSIYGENRLRVLHNKEQNSLINALAELKFISKHYNTLLTTDKQEELQLNIPESIRAKNLTKYPLQPQQYSIDTVQTKPNNPLYKIHPLITPSLLQKAIATHYPGLSCTYLQRNDESERELKARLKKLSKRRDMNNAMLQKQYYPHHNQQQYQSHEYCNAQNPQELLRKLDRLSAMKSLEEIMFLTDGYYTYHYIPTDEEHVLISKASWNNMITAYKKHRDIFFREVLIDQYPAVFCYQKPTSSSSASSTAAPMPPTPKMSSQNLTLRQQTEMYIKHKYEPYINFEQRLAEIHSKMAQHADKTTSCGEHNHVGEMNFFKKIAHLFSLNKHANDTKMSHMLSNICHDIDSIYHFLDLYYNIIARNIPYFSSIPLRVLLNNDSIDVCDYIIQRGLRKKRISQYFHHCTNLHHRHLHPHQQDDEQQQEQSRIYDDFDSNNNFYYSNREYDDQMGTNHDSNADDDDDDIIDPTQMATQPNDREQCSICCSKNNNMTTDDHHVCPRNINNLRRQSINSYHSYLDMSDKNGNIADNDHEKITTNALTPEVSGKFTQLLPFKTKHFIPPKFPKTQPAPQPIPPRSTHTQMIDALNTELKLNYNNYRHQLHHIDHTVTSSSSWLKRDTARTELLNSFIHSHNQYTNMLKHKTILLDKDVAHALRHKTILFDSFNTTPKQQQQHYHLTPQSTSRSFSRSDNDYNIPIITNTTLTHPTMQSTTTKFTQQLPQKSSIDTRNINNSIEKKNITSSSSSTTYSINNSQTNNKLLVDECKYDAELFHHHDHQQPQLQVQYQQPYSGQKGPKQSKKKKHKRK